ncbi:5'-nucleotidase [Prunus dulcis]|uniref:5'-nucleotidase n=1 Tax=Prunus dulcis TaxID=3755 RepID=A0A4Y1RX72_PRUDU|nr:5'-nucleotidase [Prunus dulcis]
MRIRLLPKSLLSSCCDDETARRTQLLSSQQLDVITVAHTKKAILGSSRKVELPTWHCGRDVDIVKQNGLVVSAKLFQTNIRFVGYNICQS